MNDKSLCERLANNETSALESIIESYSGYVRTVAGNFSRGSLSPQDIDEIVSDVFFNLWNRRRSLNPELGLRAYLSAAVRNAVKNRFRQRKITCEDIDELNVPSDNLVERSAELHEIMSCLNDALRLLDEDDREIFFRFYFYGEKSSLIAQSKNMSENTVCTKLRRTRIKLKNYLTERGFEYV